MYVPYEDRKDKTIATIFENIKVSEQAKRITGK
jgi:hypothetical protein